MASEQVARNLDAVRGALERKGFDSLLATHYRDTPVSHVLLHDDHGQSARGESARIEQAIEASSDLDGLWSALDRAEMTARPLARQS